MLTYLLAIPLLLIGLVTGPASTDWSKPVAKVQASTVRLSFESLNMRTGEMGEAVCTAFSIKSNKGAFYHNFLTAAHCSDENMLIDKKPALSIYVNTSLDLMVVQVAAENFYHPPLKPSTRQLVRGLEVGALGYGFGFTEPLFRAGHISHPGYNGIESPWGKDQIIFIFDGPYIGGMSGGPVFDQDGRVVSIIQMSNSLSGLGRPISVIYSATAQYWN